MADDQQLAAIGAGVLRDIKQTHGALHLGELHRFTNPAEAAASLALRQGQPAALTFYLDHDRIHVGDIAKTTEDAFTAWAADRSAGLDAIMLAPTRGLVAELNRAPGRIVLITPRRQPRCVWPTAIRRVLEMDHHPSQRPPPPPHRHRLGEERRPVDHHQHRPAR